MKEQIKSALQDVNGQTSSNRLFLALIVLFILLTSGYVTFTTGVIPNIGDSWIYLVGIFAGAAGWGKATEAAKSFSGKEETDEKGDWLDEQ